ncbi:hypothetical protein [Clostera anachoreta granulovirus]|uniref:Uncharacterized protein n=1 Tax=Clostera anachoreta granulovirus TaxID=283675 RepID=F4ZKP7_9BBAC|nr:hypothetical protein ClanGV_gp020 [Clostera anachoreta granulovirus]AEB00308.1 hypothetical protein [Clostera anachoreta granulovirus]
MILLFTIITVLCLVVLFVVKLNRGQEVRRLLYEHKYIPADMGKIVEVVKL